MGQLRPVAVALGLVLTAGCGLSVDDDPRPLELPATTTTTAATTTAAGEAQSAPDDSAFIYQLTEGALVAVTREVEGQNAQSLLDALLNPGDSEPAGTTTAIPAGTSLLEVSRAGSRVTVDLSEEFDNVVGTSRQQAIGQIVMTLTGLSDVRLIAFRVEGREVSVSSPARGDRESVADCDFATLLLPESELAEKFGDDPAVVEHQSARLRALEACPEPVGSTISAPA
jgi:hypothetical protein